MVLEPSILPVRASHVDCKEKGIQYYSGNDVLLGRGGRTNTHGGNLQFRMLVSSNKRLYFSHRSRSMKRAISKSIVWAIRAQMPPGRFLQQDSKGLWHDVGEAKAVEKTSQALREVNIIGKITSPHTATTMRDLKPKVRIANECWELPRKDAFDVRPS